MHSGEQPEPMELSEEDRRFAEWANAETARRIRENDFNFAPHAPEKAMGFPGDTILVRRGRAAPDAEKGDGEVNERGDS